MKIVGLIKPETADPVLVSAYEKGYDMVSKWWEGHGWPTVPVEVLPSLGAIVTEDLHGVAAAWLYMDNSCGVAMMEWTVTNPRANPRTTIKAIPFLIGFFKEEAKALGYHKILTTCRQESLARLFERNGFTKTDSNMIHLITDID